MTKDPRLEHWDRCLEDKSGNPLMVLHFATLKQRLDGVDDSVETPRCPHCYSLGLRMRVRSGKARKKAIMECKVCRKRVAKETMPKRTATKKDRADEKVGSVVHNKKGMEVPKEKQHSSDSDNVKNSAKKKKRKGKRDPDGGLTIPKELLSKRKANALQRGDMKLLKLLRMSENGSDEGNALEKFLVSE